MNIYLKLICKFKFIIYMNKVSVSSFSFLEIDYFNR